MVFSRLFKTQLDATIYSSTFSTLLFSTVLHTGFHFPENDMNSCSDKDEHIVYLFIKESYFT